MKDFVAAFGKLNCDLLFAGMPRIPNEGEEIYSKGPVLEHGAVAAVSDELVRMLCHGGVKVVLDHHHDGRSLARA